MAEPDSNPEVGGLKVVHASTHLGPYLGMRPFGGPFASASKLKVVRLEVVSATRSSADRRLLGPRLKVADEVLGV